MKTEAILCQCATCRTWFNPDHSQTGCPHSARRETAKLRDIREAGKPYKLDPTRFAPDQILNELIENDLLNKGII